MAKLFATDAVREGPIQFEESTLGFKKFKSRYLVVQKTGILQVWESAAKKKSIAIISLEGGESVEMIATKDKKFSYGFTILDDKRPWVFACSTKNERDLWVRAANQVLKQLTAISHLEEMVGEAKLDTVEGQLEFAKTMASLGQLDKARRAYSKLIVDNGDNEAIHHQFETFLVIHDKDFDSAEDNFVRRLRFLCVDKKFCRTKAGRLVRPMTQRMAFFCPSDPADVAKDDTGININQYRVTNSFHGSVTSEEEAWPRWLFKINSGCLDQIRKYVTPWMERDPFPLKKFEYSFQEIEQQTFQMIKECVTGQKGAQKVQIRLTEVLKTGDGTGDGFEDLYADEDGVPAAVSGGSGGAAGSAGDGEEKGGDDYDDVLSGIHSDDEDDEDGDGFDLDSFLAGIDDADEDYAGAPDDTYSADIDSILGKGGGGGGSSSTKKARRKGGGRTEDSGGKITTLGKKGFSMGYRPTVKLEDLGGIVDEMELSFFDNVESKLGNFKKVHINTWTALILVWIVRRDLFNHIGGSARQAKYVRVILEFMYVYARGCFQHFADALDRRLMLAAIFNMCDPADPDESKYKLCLQAVKVLCDPRVEYKHKKAIFNFIENEGWLRALATKAHKISSTAMLTKGLRAEMRKSYMEFDVIYSRELFGHEIYPKLLKVTVSKFVKEAIAKQDHERVQGKTTWGPRAGNTFDNNAFSVVASHRGVSPFSDEEARGLDFDQAYLKFCISLAEKLKPQLKRRVRELLVKQAPEIDETEARSVRSWERRMRDLKDFASPKAARFLDYCSLVLAFDNLKQLLLAFLTLDKSFTIVHLVNQMTEASFVRNNVRHLYVYILVQHEDNRLVKMICELRLTLKSVLVNEKERITTRDHFEQILTPKIVYDVQKEVWDSLGENKKEHAKKLRDAAGA